MTIHWNPGDLLEVARRVRDRRRQTGGRFLTPTKDQIHRYRDSLVHDGFPKNSMRTVTDNVLKSIYDRPSMFRYLRDRSLGLDYFFVHCVEHEQGEPLPQLAVQRCSKQDQPPQSLFVVEQLVYRQRGRQLTRSEFLACHGAVFERRSNLPPNSNYPADPPYRYGMHWQSRVRIKGIDEPLPAAHCALVPPERNALVEEMLGNASPWEMEQELLTGDEFWAQIRRHIRLHPKRPHL
jgi:hypothetical protein